MQVLLTSKQKLQAEFGFLPESLSLPDSLCNGKPGDCTQEEWQCYIVEATVSFHTLQKYQTTKSFSGSFPVSSSSLPPEHHSLFSFLHLLPQHPPKPTSASHFRHFLFNLELERGSLSIRALIYLLLLCVFFPVFQALALLCNKKHILNEITISLMLQNLQLYLELHEANVTNKVQRKLLSFWLALQIRKKHRQYLCKGDTWS